MRPTASPQMRAPASRWLVWWIAIRPRTLSLALAPVCLGAALAWADGTAPAWLWFGLTVLCALLIQIGTNLHNDVADFECGGDLAGRVGPLRVTAAGWATAQSVRRASALSFLLALLLGAALVWRGGVPILTIGLASLLAGWAYSGASQPLSHSALGELLVLVFFGLLAVVGSYWLQSGSSTAAAWLAGALLGLPAAAVLLVNNYRDLELDLRQGRRTLAARLGDARAARLYAALLLIPFALLALLVACGYSGALLAYLALPYALKLAARLRRQACGAELNALLAATAKLGLLLGLLLSIGVLL